MMRVFNYNTMEKVKTWEAHTDYIRSLAVHPTQPYIISAADDMYIKLWNFEKDFANTMTFTGHTHYVMQIEINPKDLNTFASASLDRTIRVWGLNSPEAHFALEGHERGVNCVSYFAGGDRPFLISGGDDYMVKIWDYQAKSCIATLEGHSSNVSAVLFHPRLPIILSGSEDGTLRIWHSTTFRLENTLNYGMDRGWALAAHSSSNKVAVGYDEGTVMLQLGQEEPVMSMDNSGNVVWVDNHDIRATNVRAAGKGVDLEDGESMNIQQKDLGSCEIYPQYLEHSPNGRNICLCGDGEYTIYMARTLRNVSFGNAIQFAWSRDSRVFATRETNSVIRIFRQGKEIKNFRPSFAVEEIFGGTLLGIRSTTFIDFYDFTSCKIVRRILSCPNAVYWSLQGSKVAIACDEQFYILQYNQENAQKFIDENIETDEDGIARSFERHQEVREKVITGHWAGDYCFIYNNSQGRLKYYVGDEPDKGEVLTLAHVGRPLYLLGYLQRENRVYLMDKHFQIVSYALLMDVLTFQIDVVSGDLDEAENKLANIPREHHNKLARFLEAQGKKDLALRVTQDPEHQFELAWQLDKLQDARDILLRTDADSEPKWRQLSEKALKKYDLVLAQECAERAKDVGLLLLLHSSTGNREGLTKLVDIAREAGMYNIAFVCLFLLNKTKECVQLLVDTGRLPEAAFMARTYAPSQVGRVVDLWRKDLQKVSPIIAKSIASPADPKQVSMFPDFAAALDVEKWLEAQNDKTASRSAASYLQHRKDLDRDLIQDFRSGALSSHADLASLPEQQTPRASLIGDGPSALGGSAYADESKSPAPELEEDAPEQEEAGVAGGDGFGDEPTSASATSSAPSKQAGGDDFDFNDDFESDIVPPPQEQPSSTSSSRPSSGSSKSKSKASPVSEPDLDAEDPWGNDNDADAGDQDDDFNDDDFGDYSTQTPKSAKPGQSAAAADPLPSAAELDQQLEEDLNDLDDIGF